VNDVVKLSTEKVIQAGPAEGNVSGVVSGYGVLYERGVDAEKYPSKGGAYCTRVLHIVVSDGGTAYGQDDLLKAAHTY